MACVTVVVSSSFSTVWWKKEKLQQQVRDCKQTELSNTGKLCSSRLFFGFPFLPTAIRFNQAKKLAGKSSCT
jgi:hypothetical protein